MRAFQYEQAVDTWDAVSKFRPGTAYLGGGTNLVDLMRLGVAEPDHIVDVSRLLGVFAVGRIIDPALARSQFVGGMTMGLGMALMEQTVVDQAQGGFVRRDLAQYHIATCADVQDLDAVWIDEQDPHLNPMGAKGIGEIGITGTAAAIGNAVYHATGRRIRDLPITPAKLLE
jgi:xanthine dehydrogenase YagR molybdenum-binding subunit